MTLAATPLPDAFLSRPIAHRGLHDLRAGRPENGLAAIRAAMAAGYGIEIDLQLSADGVAMVFHDEGLRRLTGEQGLVAERTAAELGRLRLGGGDEGIPTLPEVLALVGGRVPLLVEVKDQTGVLGPVDGVLEAAAARALNGYAGPVAVMSFNPHSVMALRDLAPDLPRGLTTDAFDPGEWPGVPEATCERLRGIPDYDAACAGFLSHDWRDLSRPRVSELKAAGARLLCWTVRSAAEERAARLVAETITFEGYRA
ncbi:glycerophosphodiester phosphodiesterase family protein [Rubellimicrobium aerolatum]|uniref:Glycerophosphodiester phosphodiesterase family protein n=1 Tax=Rubellimicrobium aerolatum TaxID=490979 RepID=A0ABW0SAL5_9RHOB|nr:glycerophosphodiester phosphodiesterase family protein [Rubellimicrobium aerolatum]MBP1806067.1 glycerophosphoryl diester phosphodiesterase [Rubellimicrobium aerolatum]